MQVDGRSVRCVSCVRCSADIDTDRADKTCGKKERTGEKYELIKKCTYGSSYYNYCYCYYIVSRIICTRNVVCRSDDVHRYTGAQTFILYIPITHVPLVVRRMICVYCRMDFHCTKCARGCNYYDLIIVFIARRNRAAIKPCVPFVVYNTRV